MMIIIKIVEWKEGYLCNTVYLYHFGRLVSLCCFLYFCLFLRFTGEALVGFWGLGLFGRGGSSRMVTRAVVGKRKSVHW